MNPRTNLAFVALLGLAACAVEQPAGLVEEAPSFSAAGVEHEGHIVMFNSLRGVPANFAGQVASLGGTVTFSLDEIGVASVTGLSDDALATLARRNDVRHVFPDEIFQLELPDEVEFEAAGEVANADAPHLASQYARQWNMRAIQADVAWAGGHLGSPDVTVAILDTGLDYTYPDLVGVVDLSRSASFITSPDPALIAANFPGAHPVADLHWHGTHVGSTVASQALVTAGVTSKTTLIGVKVCNVNGSCPTSGVLAGIIYAADQGADIINMSLGGLFLKRTNPGFVATINRVFNYAYRQGTLIVTSAGNSCADLDRDIVPQGASNIRPCNRTPIHFPSLFASYCNAPNAVCVSALGPSAGASVTGPWANVDGLTDYSNYGRSAIDVSAPGGTSGQIGTPGAVWAGCSRFSFQVPVCRTGIFIIGASGTSMASPHAAGVAALLAAHYGRSNPSRIKTALQQTADDLGDPGTDPYYGKGRVNAARAAGVN